MNEENKYNIKINPQKPSKKDIQEKMDFDGAFKAYTHKAYRTPWSRFQRHSNKNKKISMFIILIIVIGTLVFLESENELNNEEEKIELLNDSLNISNQQEKY